MNSEAYDRLRFYEAKVLHILFEENKKFHRIVKLPASLKLNYLVRKG